MSTPPDERDEWADPPDRWAEDDRAWKEKWTDKAPGADSEASGGNLEPPSSAYRPERASIKSVTDSYEAGMREAGPHLTIGIQIAASMLAFGGAGGAVDNWAGTSPWGVLIGTALGFAGVMTLIVRLARDADSGNKK